MAVTSSTVSLILSTTDIINATTPVEAPSLPFSPAWAGILGFLAAVVSFITVVGNLLVITAFFVERSLRSATNYFIASLAITDLLIGMFSMNLYTLYLLLGKWPLGRIICDLWLSLDYTACLTSQYTVFCITVDRFCSVKIPAKYRKWRTERKVRIMVAMTWILPAALFWPSVIAWPYVTGDRRPDHECYAEFSVDVVYNTILTICYYWITLVVMIILYIGIYRVALNLARKSEAKRQKVSNLMSKVGETTTKIGLGVTNASKNADDSTQSPNRPLMMKDNKSHNKGKHSSKQTKLDSKRTRKEAKKGAKRLKVTTSSDFNSTSRADDDRSSSPVLPSDSDNAPPTPEPVSVAKKCPNEEVTLVDIQSPVLLDVPIQQPQPITVNVTLTNSSDSDYHTASGLSFDNPAADVGLRQYSIPERDMVQYALNAPPDEFEGLRYIDEESIKSNPSIDSMRLLIDLLPQYTPGITGSPIWKRRTSFVFQNDSNDDCDKNKDNNNHVLTRVDSDSYDRTITTVVECLDDIAPSNEPASRIPKRNIQASIRSAVADIGSRLRSRLKSQKKEKAKQSRTENRARKALKTITLILGAFVACWTPYHVFILVRGACQGKCINDHLFNLGYWLCYMNSPINPFCYALANAQFKKAFLRILRLDLRRR